MGGWFYNSRFGELNRVPTIAEAPYFIPGGDWHELKVPYTATRNQAIAEAKKEFPGAAQPGGSIVHNVIHYATSGNGLNFSNIGNFITGRSLWIRVSEGILGGALILIAVSKLGGNSRVGQAATSVARKVKIL